jgi:hypothetical protein
VVEAFCRLHRESAPLPVFLLTAQEPAVILDNVKTKQKRVTPTADYQARIRRSKKAKSQTPAPKNALSDLYTRLDQTQPGSEESKLIADRIIDALGKHGGGQESSPREILSASSTANICDKE